MKNKFYKKSVCIISDCFIPTKNSAAGMLFNLSNSFLKDGAFVTCIHSGKNPKTNKLLFKNYDIDGIKFITTDCINFLRDKNVFFRFVFEIGISLILFIKVIRFYKYLKNVDLIIWYGPSSFLWLPTLVLKRISNAPIYYILRDIFPDWLKSIGLIKSKVLYAVLNLLSHPQYLIPNKIGLESPENIYLVKRKLKTNDKLEVLYNWPSIIFNKKEDISNYKKSSEKHKLSSKIKVVYSGNFGIAQDATNIIEFFNNISTNKDFNIHLYSKNNYRELEKNNLIIEKNIVQEFDLPKIFISSHCGMLSLNRNLTSNNIPGKFVSYTQFGLPILCFANKKSKISKIIIQNECGIVIDHKDNLGLNLKKLNNFFEIINNSQNKYSKKSISLHKKLFNINLVKKQVGKLLTNA